MKSKVKAKKQTQSKAKSNVERVVRVGTRVSEILDEEDMSIEDAIIVFVGLLSIASHGEKCGAETFAALVACAARHLLAEPTND